MWVCAMNSCETPERGWEQNSGHLQAQEVPLSTEPPLQPPFLTQDLTQSNLASNS